MINVSNINILLPKTTEEQMDKTSIIRREHLEKKYGDAWFSAVSLMCSIFNWGKMPWLANVGGGLIKYAQISYPIYIKILKKKLCRVKNLIN